MSCRQHYVATIVQCLFARDFHEAAVPRLSPSAYANVTVVTRNLIRPNNNLPTIAISKRIRGDGDIRTHIGSRSVNYIRILTLEITAD